MVAISLSTESLTARVNWLLSFSIVFAYVEYKWGISEMHESSQF